MGEYTELNNETDNNVTDMLSLVATKFNQTNEFKLFCTLDGQTRDKEYGFKMTTEYQYSADNEKKTTQSMYTTRKDKAD